MIRVLSITTLLVSFSAFSGGGGSWSPSISPGHCVTASFNPFTVSWNDMAQCREAIEKGYATGVGFSGPVTYGTGTQVHHTRYFNGVVKPGTRLSAAQMGVPEIVDGHKINGVGKISAFWAN